MIPSERAHLRLAARSHPGMKRDHNEDRYAVSAFWLDETRRTPALFAVLSDGIGGHQAGEVAAEIAVERISREIASSSASQPVETLRQALAQAGQAILSKAAGDPALNGMGATCACCWVIGDQLYIAYVGDSRIFLLRNGEIRQISKDHTWVQEALESGVLSPEQARNHPNMHIIRRFLGSPRAMQADTRMHLNSGESNAQAEANQGLRLSPGDVLLLCSDGLSDLVEMNELPAILSAQPLEPAVEALVALSNQRGGHDNITVIALQMPGAAAQPASAPAGASLRSWRLKRAWFIWVLLGASLLCGLLALAGWLFFASQVMG